MCFNKDEEQDSRSIWSCCAERGRIDTPLWLKWEIILGPEKWCLFPAWLRQTTGFVLEPEQRIPNVTSLTKGRTEESFNVTNKKTKIQSSVGWRSYRGHILNPVLFLCKNIIKMVWWWWVWVSGGYNLKYKPNIFIFAPIFHELNSKI